MKRRNLSPIRSALNVALESADQAVDPVETAIAEATRLDQAVQESVRIAASLESISSDLRVMVDRGDVTPVEQNLMTIAVNNNLQTLGQTPLPSDVEASVALESVSSTIKAIWKKIVELARKAWEAIVRAGKMLSEKVLGVNRQKRVERFNLNLKEVEKFKLTIKKAEVKPIDVSFFQPTPSFIQLKDGFTPDDILKDFREYAEYLKWFTDQVQKDRAMYLRELEKFCRSGIGVKDADINSWLSGLANLSPRDFSRFNKPISSISGDIDKIPVEYRGDMKATPLFMGSVTYAGGIIKRLPIGTVAPSVFINRVLSSYYVVPISAKRDKGNVRSATFKDTDGLATAKALNEVQTDISKTATALTNVVTGIQRENFQPKWVEDLNVSFLKNIEEGADHDKYQTIYQMLMQASGFFDRSIIEHLAHATKIIDSVLAIQYTMVGEMATAARSKMWSGVSV